MTYNRILRAALLVGVACGASACSTSFWYTQIQGSQYEKCEQLSNAEDRRRCKAETYPDEDKYKKSQKSLVNATR